MKLLMIDNYDSFTYNIVQYFGELGADVEAVSYTHLRAHETVLDLVCRLLLEKKKQQIQSYVTCILYR